MSLKNEFRQSLASEQELIATERRMATEASAGAVQGNCPTKAQWMLFVAGRLNETQAAALAEHLVQCESCHAILSEIRSQQEVAERRIFSGKKLVVAAIAAAVLVAVVLATWLIRGRFSPQTVIADLRNVTRGVDTASDSLVILHRNTRHLRILLPPQAVEGQYEIAVFDPLNRTTPLVTKPASSTRAVDSLVLETSVSVSDLQSGPYLLGVRHDNSEWAYYAIRID
jgi:hypothetical protein